MNLLTSLYEQARNINMDLESIASELKRLNSFDKQRFNTYDYMLKCHEQADLALYNAKKMQIDARYSIQFWVMIKKALDGNLNSNSLSDKQRKDFIHYFKNKEGSLIFKYWNKEKTHIAYLANQTISKEKRASKIKKFLFHLLLINSMSVALGMAYYCCSKKYPDIVNQLRKRNNQKSL